MYKNARVILLVLFILPVYAFSQKSSIVYTISMENPEWHYFHVELTCTGIKKENIDFKMPVWTPGYYQRMDFAKNVERFKATDVNGNELTWTKTSANTWRVAANNAAVVKLSYDIKTTRAFVANPYLDDTRGYIVPAGVFFHIDKMISHPVRVNVIPYHQWSRVATGLDSVAGKKFNYTAPDFDILYDSPILVGNLEELPSFKVRGVTHRFIGYKLGDFDRSRFITDLKKIVDASVNLIGHIPYKHYTFIAIGPGAGGIEHLNNTTFSFSGTGFNKRESYIRTLHFLAHEYFHHYNVKRIRPIELGPFDYDNGSRTKLLWVSEGLSVYYEYLVVRRAGISTDEELFNALRGNMMAFENKPGRLYQTLEQASWETWSDGPFGRTGDEVNKTISYYDKGPAAGLIFDFKIRQLTQNKKSLDDVMRFLYKEYYQKKKRGFSSDEFRQACRLISGDSLHTEFGYVSTTAGMDYPSYFTYAGLQVDTVAKELPGAWFGFTTRQKDDSVFIAVSEFESPAWAAGIRARQQVIQVNGKDVSVDLLKQVISTAKPDDVITITVSANNEQLKTTIKAGIKKEKQFLISPVQNPSPLQKQILESWLKG